MKISKIYIQMKAEDFLNTIIIFLPSQSLRQMQTAGYLGVSYSPKLSVFKSVST